MDKLENQTGLPELDVIYEEIYQMNTKLDLPSRGVAVRIYKWALAAQKPLLITELAGAVSYDENGPMVAKITPDHILKICSNFLLADTSRVVQFCHLSAREFLEKRETDSVPDYPIDLVHSQAAISSLAFLNHNKMTNTATFTPITKFYEYARDLVMLHLEKSGKRRKQHPRFNVSKLPFL